MASKCDDFAYNRIIAFKVSESLKVKSQLSNDAFRNLRKWFEMILNHFEIESSFQKKQLLELFFSGDFQNLKKMDFFFEKVKKFKTSFLSFSMSFGLMTLIFFSSESWDSILSMVRSLHSADQQIIAFKASKCFRKARKKRFCPLVQKSSHLSSRCVQTQFWDRKWN